MTREGTFGDFGKFMCVSTIQINSNGEEAGAEEAHRPRICDAAGQMTSQPALAFGRVIVGKQMGSAGMPACPQSMAQFQPHTRVSPHVEYVSGFHAMLRYYPELLAHSSVADWRAAWLSGFAPRRFEQRIPRQRQTHRKRELNRRIEQVFLKRVNNAMLHFVKPFPTPRVRLPITTYAATVVALRTANESITRVTPLMIILTPTKVPMAQIELDGHCR
jgi:hypothetical protein